MYSWQGVFLILGFTYATYLVLELCVQLYKIQQEQKAGGFSKEFLQMLRDMRDMKDEK
tara:strand:+ start:196 stop:369 length:174 start_codon:yes stop_codon:yes gene_type:complete